MNKNFSFPVSASLELELFQPSPNTLYSLETAAYLAGVPRRSILIYCRAGLILPVYQPGSEVMEFTEESIYAIRKIEQLRLTYGLNLISLKTMIHLLEEVELLRAQLRILERA